MKSRIRLTLLLFATLAGEGYAQKKLALVIGVDGYPNLPVEKRLHFAGRDARSFAEFIESPQGGNFAVSDVHVLTGPDADRLHIVSAMNWLYTSAGSEDLVYIYFAGHSEEYRGVSYFLPYDASLENPDDRGIPAADFYRHVTRDLQAKQVIVFVDACNAASAIEGSRSPLSADLQKEWEEQNSHTGQFSMALFSSLDYQKSWEDSSLDGGHGLFTYYLLRGLRGEATTSPQGWITAQDAFNYVRENVERRSRLLGQAQTPYASPDFRSSYKLAYKSSTAQPPPMTASGAEEPNTTKPGSNPILVPKSDPLQRNSRIEDPLKGLDLHDVAVLVRYKRGHGDDLASAAASRFTELGFKALAVEIPPTVGVEMDPRTLSCPHNNQWISRDRARDLPDDFADVLKLKVEFYGPTTALRCTIFVTERSGIRPE